MSCLAYTANRCNVYFVALVNHELPRFYRKRLLFRSLNNTHIVAKIVHAFNFSVMLLIMHVYATLSQRIIFVDTLICLCRPERK